MSDTYLTYEELLEMSQSDLAEQVRFLQRKLRDARQQRTLRDWFAGQALAALLMRPKYLPERQEAAEEAYGIADAMLAAQSAEGEK